MAELLEVIIWTNFLYWASFSAVKLPAFVFFRWKIEIWILGTIYGLVLFGRRLWYGVVAVSFYAMKIKVGRREEKKVVRPRFPQNVPDIVTCFSMTPAEVVVGFSGRRAIKINLRRHHTIIGSAPGFGKTNEINSFLIQLFGKGSVFASQYDVILVDLKSDNENDFLDHWRPVLYKYYSIQEGNLEGAADIMSEILEEARKRRRKGFSKHMLIFIDEFAMLTIKAGELRVRNEQVLFELANLGRNQLTLICATQNPHHKIIPTTIRHSLDRRIMLSVTDEGHAGIIMGRTVNRKDIPTSPGDFVMYDPDKGSKFASFGGLQRGHSMFVNLPRDIDTVVNGYVDAVTQSADPRMDLYKQVAAGLGEKASIPGVDNMDQPKTAEVYYRNYKNAGAFDHSGKRGSPYKMRGSYAEGMMLIKKFIDEGKWAEAPQAVVNGGNGHT